MVVALTQVMAKNLPFFFFLQKKPKTKKKNVFIKAKKTSDV